MRSNAGKTSRSTTSNKSASRSPKPKRSNSVQKSDLSCDNIQAAAELDANSIHPQSGILEGETGDRILEEKGIIEGARGTDLPSESVELTAITLHQPWASLIAEGKKHYETRNWATNYRGSIAIHAAKKLHEDESLISLLEVPASEIPLGAVVAIAELTDCILMDEEFILKQSSFEQYLGLWEVGRYAWKLEDVKAITPIPATGKQGLWHWKNASQCAFEVGDRVYIKSNSKYGEVTAISSAGIYVQEEEEKLSFTYPEKALQNVTKLATNKLGLKLSPEFDAKYASNFGRNHKAEENGQLNLLEAKEDENEPPEPDDYEFREQFDEAFKVWLKTNEAKTKAAEFGVTIESPEPNDYEFPQQFEEDYKNWVAVQPDENLANFKEVETWNQLMDGLISAQGLAQDSPTQELNCGEEAQTSSANGTAIASDFLKSDSLEQSNLPTSNSLTLSAKSPSPIDRESSQLPPPANLSATTETDLQQTTTETASQTCSEQSENCNPSSQLLKTLPASSLAPTPPATNPEPTSDSSSTPYPRAGTMRNGVLSAAPTLPPPGVESESLLLRSPGALSSTGETRPPGKTRLESQLQELGLISAEEVVAPEFLENGYHLPIGFTNPAENRSAMELSQVQAQQSLIDHKSELLQETETTAIEEQPWVMSSTGELPLSDSSELIISLDLPPNIGALTKNELILMAGEQHQFISHIERKEFELALEKLYRVRLTGVYLQEFKKKCQHGEFQNQLKQAGIGERSAQSYMVIAKNWDIVESKAKLVALLTEENQPAIGLKWALEAVRDEKKQLKSATPPKDPDNWKTPENKEQPIVSLVKKALGGQIYLDPCSDSGCNIPATMRYFKWNDGLASHNIWEKTVFINPPFSDPFPWVERCCFEIARGNVSAAVMLLKAGVISNVGTGELINKYASAICHWRGRINFLNDEGNPVKGSDFDCVFIYFGSRLDLFRGAFGGRGTIATIENHYSSVNKKYLLKSEIPEFGNTQAEQKHLAAAVGLGNGRSGVLPDMRDRDRELAERHDPYTVVDVLSVPPMSTSTPTPAPTTPVSENLIESLGEVEIFDETPLATRQFETAKQNCLNDYITAISSNLSDFSDDQIAFLAKIINEESVKRIGF